MAKTDMLGQPNWRKRERKGEKQLMIHQIPEPILNAFKAKCAIKGVYMKDVFIEFMKKFAEKN